MQNAFTGAIDKLSVRAANQPVSLCFMLNAKVKRRTRKIEK
jgi:hypothetical protein